MTKLDESFTNWFRHARLPDHLETVAKRIFTAGYLAAKETKPKSGVKEKRSYLSIWNEHKHESWVKHTTLSKRAATAITELEAQVGAEQGKAYLEYAVRQAALDPYWSSIKGLTLDNLASNGKLGTLADKYLSQDLAKSASQVSGIWQPETFTPGLRVWYPTFGQGLRNSVEASPSYPGSRRRWA